MLTLSLYIPTTGWSQETAPFRLTGVEGNISLRYYFDDESTGRISGGDILRRSRFTYEEEIFLLTHSYIYHPNFLKLDLGGGSLFVQNRFKPDGERRSSDDILYNLTGRLTFLEQKPYPLILYYERLNPSVYLGLAEHFIQTNTKYGLNFSLRQPPSPVALHLEAFRLKSEGSGFERIVDDRIDQATVRATRYFKQDDYIQLLYQLNRQESRSGNPNLPIQDVKTTTHSADLNSLFTFGVNRQFRLTNIASYVTQPEFPSRRDFRISPDLRWEHSKTLRTFYRYNFLTSRVESVDTTNQSAAVGLDHRLYESLFTTIDIHGDDNQTTGQSLSTYGANATVTYKKRIPYGNLQLGYAARYDFTERKATLYQISVFGESHVLTSTTTVTLANDYIITSTVVVSNATRSQTFIEGIDYRLIVSGSQTQIQRLITGSILDGETVLVDYEYQTGGTVEYTLFDQTYQGNLTLFKHLNIFARYRNAPQRLVSGTPTLPLNSVRSTLYGSSIEIPFWGIVVGGEAVREDHEEDISPFQRESYDIFLQLPLPFYSTFRVTGKKVIVDNLRSTEDVDLIGANAVLQSYPFSQVRIMADVGYEEDTGGTIMRRTVRGTFIAEWRIRQLILRAEGQYARERQGDFEREKSSVKLLVKREF